VILSLASLVITSSYAASGDEFYDRLYARGVGLFGQGNYAGAYSALRLAAFGMVEDIARFETAEIYVTVSATRLKREADARAAAQRVVTAERIQKRYAALPISDAVRKEFEDAARKLLAADQMGVLRGVGAGAPPPAVTPIPAPAPAPVTPAPAPAPAPAPPSKTVQITVPNPVVMAPPAKTATPSFTDAERALNSGDLAGAAAHYRAIIDAPQVTHSAALRAAEGLYRARDFAGTVRAFARAGAIGAGEEHYHYYHAIALYETHRYTDARRELRAALPFIEVTPDVDRYRTLIEQRASE